jgi:hypothetical protein
MTTLLKHRIAVLLSVDFAATLLAASWLGAIPRVLPVAGAWQWTAVLAAGSGVWAGIRLCAPLARSVGAGRMPAASVIALALALPWPALASNGLGLSITVAASGIPVGVVLRSSRPSLLAVIVGVLWALAPIDTELSLMIAGGAALGIVARRFRVGRRAPVALKSRGVRR